MIPFNKGCSNASISQVEMEALYERLKTPVKHGPVVEWPEHFTDSPTIFCKDGTWYMYFVAIAKDVNISGYETHLANSTDLIHWEYIGPIFRRNDLNRWDSKQVAGYAAFTETDFENMGEIYPVNGNYYIAYLAGNSDGYEPDPLYMGLARSTDPTDPNGFDRLPDPILAPEDADGRFGETKTLYKSCMFADTLGVTGYPYVNAYNAKDWDDRERIYLAVSQDGEHWERYGDRAILDRMTHDPDGIITGDPQILRVDDMYVMLYFHYVKDKPAYNTFAASRDLVNWTLWEGKPLVESEFPWEDKHAHKTWFIRHNGKNYHFYCAVSSENRRVIALATSD